MTEQWEGDTGPNEGARKNQRTLCTGLWLNACNVWTMYVQCEDNVRIVYGQLMQNVWTAYE